MRFYSLVVALALTVTPVVAQQPPQLPPPDQAFSADQLDDLVAPIALYPDPLVSQILVAATYPLEIVEAFQFQQKNPSLTGPALTDAASQQNWDPSIQALVIFPDVLKRLNDDVTWTTNLGNAFLAQQQDVMDAIQRMRQSAQQAGKLNAPPQEMITNDGGYIEIEPSDPDVMYVPVYDPVWIWGPAAWYPYPHWYWPPVTYRLPGFYFGFGGPIRVGLFFGGGWHGWGGWGWHPGWGNRTVVVNNTFIHQNNFNSGRLAAHGVSTWQHDPTHREGVPYANPRMQTEFRNNVRQAVAPRSIPEPARNAPAAQGFANDRFGSRGIPANRPAEQQNRTAFGGQNNGAAANTHAEHGYSSMGPARSAPAPAPRMEAPRSMPAPRIEAPRQAPAPRSNGGRR